MRQLKDDEFPKVELLRVLLPTSYRKSALAMKDIFRRLRPDAAVSFGLATGSVRFRVEMLAVNADHSPMADNTNRRRLRKKIELRGPAVVETQLPVDPILRAMKRGGVPCDVSYHAGTFVCNHVFYLLMRRLRNRPGVPAGFVHVPPVRRPLRKGLKQGQILAGVRGIVRVVAKSLGSKG